MKQKLTASINGKKSVTANSVISTVYTETGHNQLSVDFTAGVGDNYNPNTDDAQVCASFVAGANKLLWRGDMEALKASLFTKGYPNVINKANSTQIFTLFAITPDFVFYCDETEGDDSANTMMFNRTMDLIAANYEAAEELSFVAQQNTGIEWASVAFLYMQQEQFNIKPNLLLCSNL